MSNINNKRKASDDNDNIASTKKVQQTHKTYEEQQLENELNKYTTELTEPTTVCIVNSELDAFENIKIDEFEPIGLRWLDYPQNKYKMYNKMTSDFGHPYSNDSKYLADDGMLDILDLPRSFHSFWKTGLDIYLPKNKGFYDDKLRINAVFRSVICDAHKLKCTDNGCKLVYNAQLGQTMKYSVSGILKMRQNAKFATFFIEIDEATNLESSNVKINNTLTINDAHCTVHLLQKCDHINCKLQEDYIIIDGIPPVKRICSNIVTKPKAGLHKDYESKQCYIFGTGMIGKYSEKYKSIYLTTYKVSDIYIVNF